MSIRGGLKAVAIVLVTLSAAYVLGTKVGGLVVQKKQREQRFVRSLQTKELLNKMGTLKVGDALSDHTFQGLDRQFYRLSSLLQNHTVISIFDYHCDNCIAELQEIANTVRDSIEAKHIILISGSNPLQLLELRDTYEVPCRILYDEDRLFLDQYDINTYPFNIIVDDSLRIEDVVAGSLQRDELRQLCRDDT